MGPGACHRVQLAYVDERDLAQAGNGAWQFASWPDYDASELGLDLPASPVSWSYTGAELAVALVSAAEDEGRPALCQRLAAAALGRPGAERAIRLLRLGREAYAWLADHGYRLSQ